MQSLLKKHMAKLSERPFRESLYDGFWQCLTIVFPAGLIFVFGSKDIAIAVGIGALLVCLTDTPADIKTKIVSLIGCTVLMAIVSMSIAIVLPDPFLTTVFIGLFCFLFSMINVYGSRFANVGSVAVIMMVFTIGLRPAHPLLFFLAIFSGGLWYTFGSLLKQALTPYYGYQVIIGRCFLEVSRFLKIKASFYDSHNNLDECYSKLMAAHVLVNEKQEAIRFIVLNDRLTHLKSDHHIRRQVRIAVEIIDIYEYTLAIHYDYLRVREVLQNRGLLSPVNALINFLADEIKSLGFAVKQSRTVDTNTGHDYQQIIVARLDKACEEAEGIEKDILRKLVFDFKCIHTRIHCIQDILNNEGLLPELTDKDNALFATQTNYRFDNFEDNLTLSSPIFRFSLRLSIICIVVYLITHIFFSGNYDYWVLLTVAIVTKPGYSLTKKRNVERLSGTMLGVGFGIALLHFLPGYNFPEAFLLPVFLLGYLSLVHINYRISVIFITLLAVVGLNMLGGNQTELLFKRVVATLIGCSISLTTAFLLPYWEKGSIFNLVEDVWQYNHEFLLAAINRLAGHHGNITPYKLARKRVFIGAANLFAAYHRIKDEPKSVHPDLGTIQQYMVLSHQFYSAVASVFHSVNSDSEYPNNGNKLEVMMRVHLMLGNDESNDQHLSTMGLRPHGDPVNDGENLKEPIYKEETAYLLNIAGQFQRSHAKLMT
jgi:uncharacterized membrane protein YccC